MGRWLIFFILAITIPRWSGTFEAVDTFTIAGYPITAIGTGVVMGLGIYYTIDVWQRANDYDRNHFERWRRDTEAGKSTKITKQPPHVPELRKRHWLFVCFVGLLLLTVYAQTPFIMSMFTFENVPSLMTGNGLWLYSVALVLSPELVVAALAIADSFDRTLRTLQDKKAEPSLVSRVGAAIGRLIDNIGGSPAQEPESFKCWCGFLGKSEMALRSHSKRHLNEIKKAPSAQEALRFLMGKYPASYSEEWEGPAPPTLPLIASMKEKSK